MNKFMVIGLALLGYTCAIGQNIDDALRYSDTSPQGTARFAAMGGAFGALGGDLSAISINPASSAVFNTGVAAFTVRNDNVENQSNYFGTNSGGVSESDFSFNQAGGVFVINTANTSKWSKITLGFNYDQTSNYDQSFTARGNGNASIANYFLDFAQGLPFDLLELREDETVGELYQFLGETEGFGAQQAFLGYQAFIIDPLEFDADNTAYTSNIAGATFEQEYFSNTSGYNSKAAFNIAAQYNNNLYLGLNLNSHFFDFNQGTTFFESNNSESSSVTALRFQNNLRSLGSGFSFQLGAIGKVGSNVRLGFTYDSPTWYTISDETTQRISATVRDEDGTFNTSVNPNVLNVYDEYELRTPAKIMGSVAYLFGSQGLVSFDYSYKDYSNLEFRPTNDPFFQEENQFIESQLRGAATMRLGGEYRVSEWSLRGGYFIEQSPFKNETEIGDLTGYTLGLGYDFGRIEVDLAYTNSSQDRQTSLVNTGIAQTASTQRDNNAIVGTLSLSF